MFLSGSNSLPHYDLINRLDGLLFITVRIELPTDHVFHGLISNGAFIVFRQGTLADGDSGDHIGIEGSERDDQDTDVELGYFLC